MTCFSFEPLLFTKVFEQSLYCNDNGISLILLHCFKFQVKMKLHKIIYNTRRSKVYIQCFRTIVSSLKFIITIRRAQQRVPFMI